MGLFRRHLRRHPQPGLRLAQPMDARFAARRDTRARRPGVDAPMWLMAWAVCAVAAAGCTSGDAGYGGGVRDVGGSGPFDAVFGACRGATCADGGARSDGVGGRADGAADTAAPDAGLADGEAPDTGNPDSGVPDSGVPDSGVPDSGGPDTGTPDTGTPDTGTPDAGTPDTGVPDTGTPDTSPSGGDADPTTGLAAGDLLITELHPDPSAVTDAAGEWIEVYNTTAQPIDLRGVALTDKNNKPHLIAGGAPLWVPAGGFAVLALQGTPSKNGGVTATYSYSGISLANSGSVVTLKAGDVVVDTVTYGDGTKGWPKITSGVSLSLTAGALAAPGFGAANDAGGAWCLSTAVFGAGDKGTPGQANPPCPTPAVCGNGKLEPTEGCDDGNTTSGDGCSKACQKEAPTAPSSVIVNEILFDPAAVGDSAGEWVELYNPTAQGVDIQGWKLADKSATHTIAAAAGSLVVPAGGYLVLGVNADASANGGAPVSYAWKSLAMSNSTQGGRVALYNGSGALVDEVLYQTSAGKDGWPGKVTGASYQLAPGITDAKANDAGGAWCVATQAFGKGDKGTPGKANDAGCKAP